MSRKLHFSPSLLCSPVFALSLALLLGSYSILRGIRFPNIWSYSHFLMNYEFGFIKRGAVGQFFQLFGSPYLRSYECFFVFSVSIFTICCILFVRLFLQVFAARDLAKNLAVFLFCSSLGLAYLSHTIGYFDHIGLLVALLCLNVESFRNKALIIIPAFTFCLFIHEALMVMFFPVIFLSLLVSVTAKQRNYQYFVLAIFSGVCLFLTVLLANLTLDSGRVNELYQSVQSSVDIPLRLDAFAVHDRGLSDNLGMTIFVWRNERRIAEYMASVARCLPSVLMLVLSTIVLLRQTSRSVMFSVLAALAAVSPLLLIAVGLDIHRFNAMAITTSFLIFLIFARGNALELHEGNVYEMSRLAPLFYALILFNLFAEIPLFDGYELKSFPFIDHYQYLRGVLSGTEPFPWVPKR